MARILQGLESKVVIWRKMGEILQDLVIILENKVAISFRWAEALINLIGMLHSTWDVLYYSKYIFLAPFWNR